MCELCERRGRTLHASADRHLTKLSPREQRVLEETAEELSGALGLAHDQLLAILQEEGVDLRNRSRAVRAARRAFDEYREEITGAIVDMHVEGAEAGRVAAIQRHNLAVDFGIARQETIDALREAGFEASQQTIDRMTGDIGRSLSEAFDEGLSIPDIRDRLQDDVFERMQDFEAERIARTETVAGSNEGAMDAYRDSSASHKRWVATGDDRTRDTHVDADGQVVPIDSRFVVGGVRASHPGDPNLPVEERVNCRCTVAPVFEPAL